MKYHLIDNIPKLSYKERTSLEGDNSSEEATFALKNMSTTSILIVMALQLNSSNMFGYS